MYQAFFKTLILNSMYCLARVFITFRTKCTLHMQRLLLLNWTFTIVRWKKGKCTTLFLNFDFEFNVLFGTCFYYVPHSVHTQRLLLLNWMLFQN